MSEEWLLIQHYHIVSSALCFFNWRLYIVEQPLQKRDLFLNQMNIVFLYFDLHEG